MYIIYIKGSSIEDLYGILKLDNDVKFINDFYITFYGIGITLADCTNEVIFTFDYFKNQNDGNKILGDFYKNCFSRDAVYTSLVFKKPELSNVDVDERDIATYLFIGIAIKTKRCMLLTFSDSDNSTDLILAKDGKISWL